MDLFALILVLILYFLRPQEWGGIFSGLHPIQLVSALVIIALLRKEGGFKIKTFFQTPHHWIVFIYFGWTIFASPTPWETFTNIQSSILFFVLAVQALTTVPRLKTFMSWWAWLIMAVVILALLSTVGIDPLGSYELTQGSMKGRLSLNLTIFNNPNALAHSIVPVIPMLYFLLFWKRIVMKPLAVVMLLPIYCIYLTLSKGAFLCGFATVATTLTFGRPKAMQVLILVVAVTVGITALYTLPRMGELSRSKSDPAIQGRVAAARFGLQCMQRSWFGNGWGRFTTEFYRHGPLERRVIHEFRGQQETNKFIYVHYGKAAHGAYNQNGADLGFPGLFLFVGIMYCCLRTLVTAQTRDVEEERIRRMLFAIVISFAVSSWMCDFFYRSILFLFAAATAALHIILSKPKETALQEIQNQAMPWREQLRMAVAPVLGLGPSVAADCSVATVQLQQMLPAEPSPAAAPGLVTLRPLEPEASTAATMKWKRYGVLDFLLNWGLTLLVIEYWKHLLKTM